MAVYGAFVIAFWDFSIDDVFISFRYAENLTDGYGLVFNPGDSPVEGYSNFLWVLLLAFTYKLGWPTYLVAKVIGVIFTLATAGLWSWFFRNDTRPVVWLAAPIFLICPITALWAVSGLELGLYAFLVASVVISLLGQSGLHHSRWVYPSLVLLVLCRPEGFIIGAVAVLLASYTDLRETTLNIKVRAFQLGTVIATTLSLMAFRVYIFGYPLPNTIYAKTGGDAVLSGLSMLGITVLPLLPAVALLLWKSRTLFSGPVDRSVIIMAGLFLSQLAISSMINPVMNFHQRYLIAYLPLLLIVALSAVAGFQGRRLRLLLTGIVAGSLLASLVSITESLDREAKIAAAQLQTVEVLSQLPDSATVALSDAGRIPYYADNYFYDIWGLADERTGQEGFDPLRAMLLFPDYFLMVGFLRPDSTPEFRFGTERMIAEYDIFARAYRRIAVGKPPDARTTDSGYYYFIY
ncbi:MAG: hypothetical protein KAT79_02560, partial [candidate division Zixibacteria bacterium]|nr:hypothetical protein [candidate division Zixibacteria bacterium]